MEPAQDIDVRTFVNFLFDLEHKVLQLQCSLDCNSPTCLHASPGIFIKCPAAVTMHSIKDTPGGWEMGLWYFVLIDSQ